MISCILLLLEPLGISVTTRSDPSMYAPAIKPDSLGMGQEARRQNAIDRGADAMHDLLAWSPPSRTPAMPGLHATRDRIEANSLIRRVLFTGKFWMSDEPVAAWRPLTKADAAVQPHRPVSELAAKADAAGARLRALGVPRSALVETGATAPAGKKATNFAELALEPLDGVVEPELSSVQELARMELRVEVVKFSKPAAYATGVSTGRVLAVSENFAAQDLGGNRVVIHENKNLDRKLQAGEKVTLAYEDGQATVYDGLSHDVNIDAPWMPREQQRYMRMVMLDALAAMKAPQAEDEKLRDALQYALESTASFFGASESRLNRVGIQLVVNENKSLVVPDGSPAESRVARASRP